MPIFKNFYKRKFNENDIKILQELEINGQSQDNNQQDTTTDYTADNNQHDANTNNDAGGGQETTDYTQSDTSTDTPAPAGNPGDPGATEEMPTTDYTADGGGDAGGGDVGGGETTDYTQDDGTGEEGDPNAAGDTGDMGDPGGGEKSDDEIKQLEDELFSSFTPEQLDIKNRELKKLYIDLYDTTEAIIGRINEIPKIEKYLSIVEFVSDKLADLRSTISDYLNGGTYKSLSYTENMINYNKFVAVLHGINKIIEEIKVEDDQKDKRL